MSEQRWRQITDSLDECWQLEVKDSGFRPKFSKKQGGTDVSGWRPLASIWDTGEEPDNWRVLLSTEQTGQHVDYADIAKAKKDTERRLKKI